MPFDGNGTYTPLSPPYPAVAGTAILASDWNSILSDLATALSNCVTRDGQSALLADLNVAGFDLLNAKATTPASSTTGKQVQTSAGVDAKIAAAEALLVTTGTFTPTVRGSTTAGVFTDLSSQGSWVKVGNLVFVNGQISYQALTGTGFMQIGGIPFTAVDIPIMQIAATNINFSGYLVGKMFSGNLIDILQVVSGAVISNLPVDVTGTLLFSGCFKVA
jgi:hypothetical protein